jgi:quercetin 2,3-dioxygenase
MSSKTSITRETTQVITAHRQREGAGFIVRRPVPTVGLEYANPFLLLDEMGPVEYAPGEAVGAPDHPHRGFETVTYMLEGEFEHEDSAGHRGHIRAGDVQWMTAGAGIVHSEMPSKAIRQNGGRSHGFQIWVNLPSHLKMTRPRYQEVPAARIPEAQTGDGLARVRVIAGEALGVHAVIDTHTPVVYQDWSLSAGADVTTTLAPEFRGYVYVFSGAARIGDGGRLVTEGQLAVLGPGDAVRLRGVDGASASGRLLLLGGIPIEEPIVRHGPFVMNTKKQIIEAFQDYQTGKMGEITRTAEHGAALPVD